MDTTQTITVIGASRGTGALLVEQALAAGHHVRAVARTASRLSHPNLTAVTGDATDPAVLRRAIQHSDAVAVVVGAPAPDRSGVRAATTRATIAAMKDAGVDRLVVQSSLGVGDSHARLDLYSRFIVFPFVLKHVMVDHHAQEEAVRASGLDWTILRPGYLGDGSATGTLRAIPSNHPGRLNAKVTRADVARVTLEVLLGADDVGRELMLVGLR